jgi:hypothetical protein
MVVRCVEPTKRLKFAILIASMIVSGALGLLMVASFLVQFLLDLPDKTDKNILAKFNISRSMEVLLALEIHQNMMAPVLIQQIFLPVVPAALNNLGVTGLPAL